MERKITHVTLRDRVHGNGAATSQGWTTTDRHTSSPCGTPEKAEGTWGDNGRDGLISSKDLRGTSGPEVRKTECCGKNSKKTLTL